MAKNNFRGGFRTPFKPGMKPIRPVPYRPKKWASKPTSTFSSRLGEMAGRYAKEKAYEFGIGVLDSLRKPMDGGGVELAPIPLKGSIVTSPAVNSNTETVFRSVLASKPSAGLKRALSMAQRLEFKMNQDFSLTSANNKQAVSDLALVFGSTNANTPQNTYYYSCGFMTGDFFSGTSSTVNGHLSTAFNLVNPATSAFVYMEDCYNELNIYNTSTFGAVVDIYECVSKHDLSAVSSSFGSNNIGICSPGTFWNIGMESFTAAQTAPSGVTVGKQSISTIGTCPTDSILFNQFWSVASKVRLNLSGGSVHTHRSTYVLNKAINVQRFKYSTLLQGITRNYLIVYRGTPATGTSSQSVDVSATLRVTNNCIFKGSSIINSQTYTEFADTSSAA